MTRTRGGLCKYSFKVPDYDSVESILDFAYLQHTIKSLAQLTGDGMKLTHIPSKRELICLRFVFCR